MAERVLGSATLQRRLEGLEVLVRTTFCGCAFSELAIKSFFGQAAKRFKLRQVPLRWGRAIDKAPGSVQVIKQIFGTSRCMWGDILSLVNDEERLLEHGVCRPRLSIHQVNAFCTATVMRLV